MTLNKKIILIVAFTVFVISTLIAAALIPINTKYASEHCTEIQTRYSVILGQKSAYEEIEEKEVWKPGDYLSTGDCYLSYTENKVKLYIF